MTANFQSGYHLHTGEALNTAIDAAQGTTGPTGPTGPAFSTSGPTFTGTTTVAALTATGAVIMSNASIKMSALPTADPHVVNVLWNNSGVVTVSAG